MAESENIPYPLLLTDCSAPGVRVGLLCQNGWLAYENRTGETGAALFQVVKELLSKAKLGLEDIQAFGYCEGPGSTLGIRINAMALRTWVSLSVEPKPVFAYRSLEAAAILIKQTKTPGTDFSILSDLRKNSWNGAIVTDQAQKPEIGRVTIDELKDWPKPRYFIQQRIHSPGLPPGSEQIEYDLELIGTNPAFLNLLRPVEQANVFQTTTTDFKKWTPSRHR